MKSALLGGLLGFALVLAFFAVAGEKMTSYGSSAGGPSARAAAAMAR